MVRLIVVLCAFLVVLCSAGVVPAQLVESPQKYGNANGLSSVCVLSSGDALLFWCEYGDTVNAVYTRVFSAGGQLMGSPVIVNDPDDYDRAYPADVAQLDNGDIVYVWDQHSGYYYEPEYLFYRRFDENLNPLTPPVQLETANPTGFGRKSIHIIGGGDGDFKVLWSGVKGTVWPESLHTCYIDAYDNPPVRMTLGAGVNLTTATCQDIFAVTTMTRETSYYTSLFIDYYTFEGDPAGKALLAPVDSIWFAQADVAVNPSGQAAVAFADMDNDEYGIYARRFEWTGDLVGDVLRVNESQAGRTWEPRIAILGSGDFLVTFESERDVIADDKYTIILRQFSAAAGIFGDSYNMDPVFPELPYYSTGNLALAAGNNRYLMTWRLQPTWVEPEYEQWVSWVGSDVSSSVRVTSPSVTMTLEQNRPKPFNPGTSIHYTLEKAADVTIEIFDVSGRRIRTFREGTCEAGRYKVEWNGRNDRGYPVASGTYLYTLQAGRELISRKMTLLK